MDDMLADDAHAILAAMPSLRQAARILHVFPSSLSRRIAREPGLAIERVGNQTRLPPESVLACARYYRKRPTSQVAFDLVTFAVEHAPAAADEIEERVNRFLVDTEPDWPRNDPDWLDNAKRVLPADLFEEVKRAAEDYARRTQPSPAGSAAKGEAGESSRSPAYSGS